MNRADLEQERQRLDQVAREAHEAGEDCLREDCQECCPHYEHDYHSCLDCGAEMDIGQMIDAAEREDR